MSARIGKALAPYGLTDARVRLLARHTNTLYRVDTADGRYVFRVSAPGLRTEREVASELSWLNALRRDTDLVVPEVVATRSGRRFVSVGSGAA
ncbi:MAG TPA: phosphotransferase, partial [Anaerolineales bacterium]|nr:phosphotransferase [Anaerolineales bacterium]